MENNANQSAFPTIGEHSHMLEGGLTKREYFAAMAMQGYIQRVSRSDYEADEKLHIRLATLSIGMADALLKHLDNGDKNG